MNQNNNIKIDLVLIVLTKQPNLDNHSIQSESILNRTEASR